MFVNSLLLTSVDELRLVIILFKSLELAADRALLPGDVQCILSYLVDRFSNDYLVLIDFGFK